MLYYPIGQIGQVNGSERTKILFQKKQKSVGLRGLQIIGFLSEPGFQGAVHNLASGYSWHLLISDKTDASRALEPGQTIAAPLTYICFTGVLALM